MTSSVLVTAPATSHAAASTGAGPAPPGLCPMRYEPDPGPEDPWPLAGPVLVGPGPAGRAADRPADRTPGPAGSPEPLPATAVAPPASTARGPLPGRAPEASRAEHIDAHDAASRQLRTALEVLDGRRPIAHLTDQAAPSVLRYWRVAAQRRRVRAPARFTRMRLCLPRSGVAEVAATCEIDGRPRALAARFERRRGRWLCTVVRLG